MLALLLVLFFLFQVYRMENLTNQVLALIAAVERAIPLLQEAADIKAGAASLADQLQVEVNKLNAVLPPQQ